MCHLLFSLTPICAGPSSPFPRPRSPSLTQHALGRAENGPWGGTFFECPKVCQLPTSISHGIQRRADIMFEPYFFFYFARVLQDSTRRAMYNNTTVISEAYFNRCSRLLFTFSRDLTTVIGRRGPRPSSGLVLARLIVQTCINETPQLRILQRGNDAFLIIHLLIDCHQWKQGGLEQGGLGMRGMCGALRVRWDVLSDSVECLPGVILIESWRRKWRGM